MKLGDAEIWNRDEGIQEELYVLAVGGGPSRRVAALECGAVMERAGLLDQGLDNVVDDLREDKAEGEEHGLELTAEEEVRDEPTQTQGGEEGDPGQEVAEQVAASVPHMGQGHGLEAMRDRIRHPHLMQWKKKKKKKIRWCVPFFPI